MFGEWKSNWICVNGQRNKDRKSILEREWLTRYPSPHRTPFTMSIFVRGTQRNNKRKYVNIMGNSLFWYFFRLFSCLVLYVLGSCYPFASHALVFIDITISRMKIGIPGREHEWREHNIRNKRRKIEKKRYGCRSASGNHSQICNTPIRFKGIRTGIKKKQWWPIKHLG